MLNYNIYDVFTETRMAGNPLAVMYDADDLDQATMQAIAREMNLSETVFVNRSGNPAHAASLRIFTPSGELPFAGHPTVGAAVAIAERNRKDGDDDVDMVCVLEEKVGPVRCAVKMRAGAVSFAEFDLPRKSSRVELPLDHTALADALGVSEGHLGFENHVPSIWTAGVPFLAVPLHNIAAVRDMDFDANLWLRTAPLVEGLLTAAYIYCRGGVNHAEDPATGSAAAALSGAIHHFDGLTDGHYPLLIEQGVEMERPSHIHLRMDIKDGEIARARIGGHAVRVASGTFEI